MAKPIDGKRPQQWAKHLRPYWKRLFNKTLRGKQKKEIRRGTES